MSGQMVGHDLLSGLDGSAGAQVGSQEVSARKDALRLLPTCSDNPIVKAATRLLNLIARIRMTSAITNPASLRKTLIEEIQFFEAQALAANVSRDEIVGARYCLCTALDEAAGQTPWGGSGVWARHSLLVTFHNETQGGEKYYQLLARLAQYPERHRQLIELLYYCNMLGFEGRFRIVENGHAQLEILKRRIAALLNGANGRDGRLSVHWQGEQTRREVWRLVPPWVVMACCALIAFALYLWLSFSLGRQSDQVFNRLVAIQAPVPTLAAPPARTVTPRLRRFLDSEIRANLLEVRDLHDRSIIILKGDGLFDSGRVEIRANYLGVLDRIAHALDEIDGAVMVTGYTDNVPIRSLRFPSNWHLSEARARAVAALIAGQMQRPERVRAEGRGEAEPVADNKTSEGRARNRRVEITLMLSGDELLRQLNLASAQQAKGGRS